MPFAQYSCRSGHRHRVFQLSSSGSAMSLEPNRGPLVDSRCTSCGGYAVCAGSQCLLLALTLMSRSASWAMSRHGGRIDESGGSAMAAAGESPDPMTLTSSARGFPVGSAPSALPIATSSVAQMSAFRAVALVPEQPHNVVIPALRGIVAERGPTRFGHQVHDPR